MSKEIKIKLDDNVHNILKEYAKEDDRSLSKYISRGLIYLAEHPYHKISPISVQTSNGEIPSPLITQSINLQQLQDMGIKDIKFNKPEKELTPEEQTLQQKKIQQQLSSIKQKRIKFLKEQCQNILGDLMPYLEENDQNVIDLVLEKYPTDEEIIAYLNEIKKEDDNYTPPGEERYPYEEEIEYFESRLPHPLSSYYEKVKQFCIQNNYTNELYQMLQYPDYNAWTTEQEAIVRSALEITNADQLSEQDWQEIASYFKKEEK